MQQELRSNSFVMKIIKFATVISIGFILRIHVYGQWENPADRYMDACKQYFGATCPLDEDTIRHFMYFARGRERIHDHLLLKTKKIAGAQIMYPWVLLEPEKGLYDFSIIREDYEYLLSYGKKLFIQLQDATFNAAYVGIPAYLLTEEYDGGSAPKFHDNGKQDGWVAKRWNPGVQKRFALLLEALGNEFDGKVQGINLQESAVEVDGKSDPSCTPKRYAESLKSNMLALKKAFPRSTTMQYANFMHGGWLPWEDNDYLRSIYRYGEKIGVGLGSPDLMVQRRGQLNHALAMMHEIEFSVPLGIAVQDGNYIAKTGADEDYDENNDYGLDERRNLVPLLYAFAKDFLKVKYIFWVDQEPYFTEDVISCFGAE